jgi:hypothetical protein
VKSFATVFYDEFVDLLSQEKKMVDVQKSGDYMQQFDPAFVAATQNLWLRLKTFDEIQTKSYEEEAAAINILVDDLQSAEYVSKVALLGSVKETLLLTLSKLNLKL